MAHHLKVTVMRFLSIVCPQQIRLVKLHKAIVAQKMILLLIGYTEAIGARKFALHLFNNTLGFSHVFRSMTP